MLSLELCKTIKIGYICDPYAQEGGKGWLGWVGTIVAFVPLYR